MQQIRPCVYAAALLTVFSAACGSTEAPALDAAPELDHQQLIDVNLVDLSPAPDINDAFVWPDHPSDFVPPPDQPVDVGDLGSLDFAGGDGGGSTCAGASPITLVNDKGTASGAILKSDTDNSVTMPNSSCVGKTTSGADRFYKVKLGAGKTYVVTVTGGSGPPAFKPALYVFSSCASPASTCLAASAEDDTTQTVTVTPKASGTYYIGVDNTWPLGMMYGSYTVTVSGSAAGGETCAKAAKLSWSGPTIAVAGDTSKATADLDPGYTCTGGKGGPGADLFYAVPVTAGKSYKVSVKPTSSWNPAIYVLSSCTNPASTCVAGSDYYPDGQTESLVFVAKATGDYIIGVDSPYPTGYPVPNAAGPFVLTVEEFKPSGNDSCTAPQALTWSGTQASASGDTAKATPTLNMSGASCLSPSGPTGTPGNDLFYSVTVTKGKGYKVTVAQTGTPVMFLPAVYVFTDCTSPASSCVAGAAYPTTPTGGTEVSFVASQTGTYLIGVDTSTPPSMPGSSGSFTLTVDEYTPPTNDLCSTPTALSWSAGKATVTDDTSKASNGVTLNYTDCTKQSSPGPDLFYSVSVTAGKSYKVTVTPGSSIYGFDPAVYVFTDCTKVASTCVAGADAVYTNQAEKLTFLASASGTMIIGVDSKMPVGPKLGSGGPFTLTVEEYTPPSNSTCAKPTTMTWSSGQATASGDTSMSSNEYAGIKCGGTTYFNGPQLYYKVALAAGKTYSATLTPSGYEGAIYAFPASTACSALAINPACYYTYSTQLGPGSPSMIKISPTTAGDWIIVADSPDVSQAGSFTLKVEEFVAPKNDSCAAAAALSFNSSGVAAVTGDTTLASNSLSLSGVTCVPGSSDGPELFYSINLTAGTSYNVMLMPSTSFDPLLYVITSCSNPTGTCVAGSSNKGPGFPEYFQFTPSTTGTYIIGVDAYNYPTYGSGSFTLTVSSGYPYSDAGPPPPPPPPIP